MHFLNAVLNDAAWWYDSLSEEFGRRANWCSQGLIGPMNQGQSPTYVILKSLSEAFAAYDERLSTPGVDETCVARYIRDQRTYLGALKKFSPYANVPNALATAAVLGFSARNTETAANVVPIRFRALMKRRLSDALRFYTLTRDRVTPHFGPGAVAEGLNNLEKWEAVPAAAKSLGYNFLTMTHVYEWMREACQTSPLPAKLHAVPKDWDKARLITIEPLGLTMLQQTARDALLAAMDLNPETRPLAGLSTGEVPEQRHRRLALAGSRDGSYATFDLKDASDRISWGQVVQVFPALVVSDLEFARSEYYADYIGCGKGAQITPTRLQMYAGMGNATTYLVETLLFWAMCHAVADYHRVGKRYVSVVGDDIIVDGRLAKVIVDTGVFADFGWQVNLRKSMWRSDVKYRESCGCQAFRGEDVTLTRISGYRDTPEGALGVVDLIRNLVKRRNFLLAQKVYEQTNLPNVLGAPAGSLSVDLCWLPRTNVPNRWSKRYKRLEYNLQGWNAKQFHSWPTRTEYVYGALTEQLDTKWVPNGHRERAQQSLPSPTVSTTGDVDLYKPQAVWVSHWDKKSQWSNSVVNSVYATLPREGYLEAHWQAAGVAW